MVFSVSDETWELISSCYEKGGKFLSPTTKILVENLLVTLQANRAITTSYEADLIISLLLSCGQSQSGTTEGEDRQHTHCTIKDFGAEESANMMLKINQLIEQLRLFNQAIEAFSRECFIERTR